MLDLLALLVGDERQIAVLGREHADLRHYVEPQHLVGILRRPFLERLPGGPVAFLGYVREHEYRVVEAEPGSAPHYVGGAYPGTDDVTYLPISEPELLLVPLEVAVAGDLGCLLGPFTDQAGVAPELLRHKPRRLPEPHRPDGLFLLAHGTQLVENTQ